MLRSNLLTTGVLLAATLGLGACRSSEDRQRAAEKPGEVSDKAEVLARQAEQKATDMRAKAEAHGDRASDDAARAAAEARAARDEFIARSNAKLSELDARIAELEARAKSHTEKATQDALVTLRQLRLDATQALENAKAAGQTDWMRVSATFDATYDKVQAALDDLYKRLHMTTTK